MGTLPIPPRTPTPPSSPERYDSFDMLSPVRAEFEPGSLAPIPSSERQTFQSRRMSNGGGAHYPELKSPAWGENANGDGARFPSAAASSRVPQVQASRQPFNFQPMVASKAPVNAAKPNQRRGHRYKHSSISHNIFQEPPPRAPMTVPASLPIPTFTEWKRQISPEQWKRVWWCCCHFLIVAYTWWSAKGSLAIIALSHLLLFDALGATMCVCVDALGNFEVWKRSTLRNPFGLERAEVLAGFAMSVFLCFMGMDIMSHTAQHMVEDWSEASHKEGGTPHSAHANVHSDHARVSPGSIDLAALLAIVATCVSAFALKNHQRIGKAMRFSALANLPSILSNPAHFFTLTCSFVLLLLPLLSVTMYSWLDRMLAFTMSIIMVIIGIRLITVLGRMLLMSINHDIRDIVGEISEDPAVISVDEARFWQVHHGLGMANLKLSVRPSALIGGESKFRHKITRIVRDRLGGTYGERGGGQQKWEVTISLQYE